MKATLSGKPESKIIPFIASICGVKVECIEDANNTTSFTDGATTLTELKDILCYIPTKSKEGKKLLGSSKDDVQNVQTWMDFYQSNFVQEIQFEKAANEMNSTLLTQSFISLPNTITLADYVLYFALYNHLVNIQDPTNYLNIFRWYNYVQHTSEVENAENHHPLLPFDVTKRYHVKNIKKAEKAAKAPKQQGDKPKEEKKEEAKVDENVISKLDIRVGRLLKVWPHPDSDKLYCEHVDVGEETYREIGSGIRPFHTQEEMENRLVCVLCNLKPRKLAGFSSNGMLLCACIDDHTRGSLVNPPEGAKVGERVIFPGMEGEPATPAQLQKKKFLEAVLPDLKTNAEGVCTYKGVPFTTSAGVVTCEQFKDCHIS
ncbi:hypothetical protein WA158_001588 [Blastocystis sp. Blastoise]